MIIDEEKRRELEQSTWESSSDTTSKRALGGISVEDQIKAIHQSQGLLDDSGVVAQSGSRIGPTVTQQQQQPPPHQLSMKPPSMMAPPPMMPPKPLVNLAPPIPSGAPFGVPPSVPNIAPPTSSLLLSDDLQPASKRLKTGEDNLIPENEFLSMHEAKGPVTFYVHLPLVPEKPEWNLNGQLISLVLPLTETVSQLDYVYCLKFLFMSLLKGRYY